jgi:hypothetical protein
MKASATRFFIYIFHFLFFSLLLSFSYAQVPTVQDCMGAIPVCQDIYVEENSYSGDGNYNNEIYEDLPCNSACPGSCLAGEVNSVWYIFTVQAAGMLRLTIDPVQATDDYDWAVYDVTELRCSDIYSSYSLMQKSCNAYGAGTNGNTGINTANGGNSNCNNCGATNLWNKDLPVLEGRTYVLVIENWSGTTQGYTLDFSASTAIIFDDVEPELAAVLADEITCGDTEIIVDFSENVMCESVNPTDFVLTGPGGPYVVLDAQGEACLLGAEMEKRYTLIIDKPISSDGTYSVQLTALSFVYDACQNFAEGNTILFEVDLGAPVINPGNMEIEAATCGLSNGSITGIQIVGAPPYNYNWIDAQGDTVGTTLDLMDVPTGEYTLNVSDQNTCETAGGPYFVEQTGAPFLDDASVDIIGAHWGVNDGHITGLVITGNEPLVYLWMDANNDSVGNAQELHNVFSGNYFLLITDAYGCDTLGGPYFVQQIGGPIGVEASADPSEICFGGSTRLIANAYGGLGVFSYSWTSVPLGFESELESPVVFPEVTTTYTVTINDGYNTKSASVTVIVHPLPTAHAGSDQTIPYGTSTTISGIVIGGSGTYQYFWEPSGLVLFPDEQSTATYKLYQTTFFVLKGKDVNTGCFSPFDTVMVALSGGPLDIAITMSEDTICVGEKTTLTAYGSGGNYDHYTYTWFYNGNQLKEETTPVSSLEVAPDSPANHVYTVEIYDEFNTFTTNFTVTVVPTPYFSILGGPQITACPLDTVLLKPNITFPGAKYYWSNGSTAPEVHLATTGIGFSVKTMNLSIINTQGCQFKDSVTVIFDFAACFGIEEYGSFPKIKIYPNPTSGYINIDLEEIDGFSEIQILNPQGSVIYSMHPGNQLSGNQKIIADLSAFPGGIYLLRAIHERFIHHEKIVLQ